MFLFLSLFALAQSCPQFYGKQNLNGSWNFSIKEEPDMVEVEVDESCKPEGGTHVFRDGKYQLDRNLLANKRAADQAEEEEKKPIEKSVVEDLKRRIEELEKGKP